MTSKNTIGTDNPRKFDAYVQLNAAKGGYDFFYDGLDRNKYRQENKREQSQSQNDDQQNKVRIPKKLLGVDLDDKQQNSLREGKSVYVQGMLNGKELDTKKDLQGFGQFLRNAKRQERHSR
jgi:hypothetical protein